MKKQGKIVVLFLLALVLGACSKETTQETDTSQKTGESLSRSEQEQTAKILASYQKNARYEIDPEIHTVKANEPITFKGKIQLNWDTSKFADFEKRPDDPDTILNGSVPLEIYSDLSLTHDLSGSSVWLDRDTATGEITFQPSEAENGVYSSEKKAAAFTLSGPGSWGLMDRYYIVQYHDLDSGKLLAKPKLLTYAIDHDDDALKAPVLSYEYLSNGTVALQWTEVAGATEYHLVKLSYEYYYDESQKKWASSFAPAEVAVTRETTWDSNKQNNDQGDRANLVFQEVSQTDDEKYGSDSVLGQLEDEKTPPSSISTLVVVASDGTNYSEISNGLSLAELAENLPLGIAYQAMDKEVAHEDDATGFFKDIAAFPEALPVSMVSGKTRFLPLKMDLEQVTIREWSTGKNGKQLVVPVQIKGTPFFNSLYINDFDEKTYAADLQEKKSRSIKNMPPVRRPSIFLMLKSSKSI